MKAHTEIEETIAALSKELFLDLAVDKDNVVEIKKAVNSATTTLVKTIGDLFPESGETTLTPDEQIAGLKTAFATYRQALDNLKIAYIDAVIDLIGTEVKKDPAKAAELVEALNLDTNPMMKLINNACYACQTFDRFLQHDITPAHLEDNRLNTYLEKLFTETAKVTRFVPGQDKEEKAEKSSKYDEIYQRVEKDGDYLISRSARSLLYYYTGTSSAADAAKTVYKTGESAVTLGQFLASVSATYATGGAYGVAMAAAGELMKTSNREKLGLS